MKIKKIGEVIIALSRLREQPRGFEVEWDDTAQKIHDQKRASTIYRRKDGFWDILVDMSYSDKDEYEELTKKLAKVAPDLTWRTEEHGMVRIYEPI